MKKTFFIALICILSTKIVLGAFDKKEVEMFVDLYEQLLTNFCNAPTDEIAGEKRLALRELFEFPLLPIAYDLFDVSKPNKPLGDLYLYMISKEYENKIKVEFSNVHIFSCIDRRETQEFALVTFDKKLVYIGDKPEYRNKQRNVKILLAINVTGSDYKINIVTFPEEYITAKGGCIIDEKQDNQNELFQNNYLIAEQAFKQKNYIAAKQYFEKSLLYKPNESRVKSLIEECNSQINYLNYKVEAEKSFSKGMYSDAKELFEKIIIQYPDNKEYAEVSIKECENKIRFQNYIEYKKIGDDYFRKEFYTTASKYYLNALNDNPGDNYLLSMIKKCNNADKTTVLKGINQARNLVAFSNKKHFPDIIKIYTYFESSGLLTGQDYYNMAAILDVGYNNVCNELKYSKDQSFHLAKEYCLKSRAKGYKSADVLWFDRFSNKSRNN
jgi:tetratricopeptide (TPR) repeat protein